MSATAIPLILVYDFGWGATLVGSGDRRPLGYEITFDPRRISEAKAVVFHIPTAPDVRRIEKREGQLWVAWSMESAALYPQLVNVEYMRQFDLTMTYRLDSDIPCPYFSPGTRDELTGPPLEKTAEAPLVYFASNSADRSGRTEFVRELMRYIAVDSYGACLNNKKLADDRGRETKLQTYSRYKFTLACENSIAFDYVTEKFFDPLIAGSVPVYWGVPNVAGFAPGQQCFIDARKFAGPRELAEHLTNIAGNEDEYNSYLAWKSRPLRPQFDSMVEKVAQNPFCRLATLLSAGHGNSRASQRNHDPIHSVVRWLHRRS